MDNIKRRLVVCDKCEANFAFIVPEKQGTYRIECPRCKKEIKFKVVANN